MSLNDEYVDATVNCSLIFLYSFPPFFGQRKGEVVNKACQINLLFFIVLIFVLLNEQF